MAEFLNFEFVDGIAFVSQGEKMKLVYSRNLVLFDSKMKDVMSVEYSDITNAEILTETEEKDKSVIGRAIVGGLILGPVGAVVGGMSGTGKKEKKHYYLRLTISYGTEEKIVLLKSYDKSSKTCEKAKNLIVDMKNGKKEENSSFIVNSNRSNENNYSVNRSTVSSKSEFKNDTPKPVKIGCGCLVAFFIFSAIVSSFDNSDKNQKATEKQQTQIEQTEKKDNALLIADTKFANGLAEILNNPYKIVDKNKVYYTKSANFKKVYFFGTVVEADGQYYNAIWATNDMDYCGAGLVFSINDYALQSSGMGDGRTNKEPITNSDDGYSRVNIKLIEDMSNLIK